MLMALYCVNDQRNRKLTVTEMIKAFKGRGYSISKTKSKEDKKEVFKLDDKINAHGLVINTFNTSKTNYLCRNGAETEIEQVLEADLKLNDILQEWLAV
jgi:hypothetical protein